VSFFYLTFNDNNIYNSLKIYWRVVSIVVGNSFCSSTTNLDVGEILFKHILNYIIEWKYTSQTPKRDKEDHECFLWKPIVDIF